MNPIPVTFSDMRTNAAGIIAIVALIAVAVALGVGISAQERAVRQGGNVAAEPFDVLIGAPGSTTQLLFSSVYLQPAALDLVDGEVLRELAGREGVASFTPIAFGDNYRGMPIIGTTAGFTTLDDTAPLVEGTTFAGLYEAVVGHDVELALGDEFTPVHGMIETGEEQVEHEHDHVHYHVVGRMARRFSPWDQAILVPVESVWSVHGLGTGHEEPSSIALAMATEEGGRAEGDEHEDERAAEHDHGGPVALGPPWSALHIPGVPAIAVTPASIRDAYVLRTEFRNDPRTTAIFPAEVLLELYALIGDASTVLAVVSVATQVLVVGAVLLAVFSALQQKREALGVLRALGAPRVYVFLAVWLHVVLMVLVGSALGVALGWGVALGISAILAERTGLVLPVLITGKEIGLAGVLVAAGMILAAIPAVTVYRQSVSEVLRS